MGQARMIEQPRHGHGAWGIDGVSQEGCRKVSRLSDGPDSPFRPGFVCQLTISSSPSPLFIRCLVIPHQFMHAGKRRGNQALISTSQNNLLPLGVVLLSHLPHLHVSVIDPISACFSLPSHLGFDRCRDLPPNHSAGSGCRSRPDKFNLLLGRPKLPGPTEPEQSCSTSLLEIAHQCSNGPFRLGTLIFFSSLYIYYPGSQFVEPPGWWHYHSRSVNS